MVHEELVDPGQAPLPDGAEVVLDAEHMSGMKGAQATIDYSTDETVYMVDLTVDGMAMTNHKWVTEGEIRPRQIGPIDGLCEVSWVRKQPTEKSPSP